MASSGYKSVAYFVNWAIYGRNYNPQDLPADKLTHVLYAFANVRPESGEVYLSDTWSDTDKHYPTDSWNDTGTNVYGCVKQLGLLKQSHRSLKVLLSIGGWTYSSSFAQGTASAANIQTFATSAVTLLKDLGLDGLDIDWEYPANPTEAAQYVALLKELRTQLTAYATSVSQDPKNFLLTVACPAGPDNYQKYDVKGMDQYLDFWNLMAYDYAGSWDTIAGHQANLSPSATMPQATPFSTTAATQFYLGQGVAPAKLTLGCPLYGRAFANTTGPGQPFNGVGEGSWENGVWDWKALPRPNAAVSEDQSIGASWCFDGGTGQGTMVSYDTIPIAQQKANWVKSQGLGGVMWWESSADKAGNDGMIAAQTGTLGGLESSQNTIAYPQSKYDNLRNGFK
ncbi:MAG: hypothetical protein Q9162_005730 [Coniocarpon cinnabarinum]